MKRTVIRLIGVGLCLAALAASAPVQEEGARSRQEERVATGVKILKEAEGYAFKNKVVLDTADGMLGRFPKRATRPREGVVDRRNSLLLLDAENFRMIVREPRRAIRLGTSWMDFSTLGDDGDEKMIILRRELERLLDRGTPDKHAENWLQAARDLYMDSEQASIDNSLCSLYLGTLDAATVGEAILEPMGHFAAQARISVKEAEGSVRFYLNEDDRLLRYRVTLSGLLSVEARDTRETFRLRLERETTFSRIGFARVTVPEPAKEILGLKEQKDDKE